MLQEYSLQTQHSIPHKLHSVRNQVPATQETIFFLRHACQEETEFSLKQSLSLSKHLDMMSGSIVRAFRNSLFHTALVLVKGTNVPSQGSRESNPTYIILLQRNKIEQHSHDNTCWYKFISTLQNLIQCRMSNQTVYY